MQSVTMNKLKSNSYSALFSKPNESSSHDREDKEIIIPNNDLEENIEINMSSESHSLDLWQLDKSWKAYLNVSPGISIILSIIKYATFLVMFGLITYVLWECKEYFKEAKMQQGKFEMQQINFNNAAEQRFKHLDHVQQTISDRLENIRILTDEGSKKIKDMFSFEKSDLLKDYEEGSGDKCEFIPLNLRFDCHPESGASELSCTQRGCCWHALHQLNFEKNVPLDVPYCFYPKNWSLYKYENFSKHGNDFSGLLRSERDSFYKEDIPLIKIETNGIDDTTLRVKVIQIYYIKKNSTL